MLGSAVSATRQQRRMVKFCIPYHSLIVKIAVRSSQVYQSRESVVTSIHSGQVDPTLLSQISNGYVDGSTVPVITKTKGLATTIVNLQSRLHIAGDIAPASSIAPTPLIEATSVTPTFDLDQLDNVKKTVYVLQTFMYTVVDEAGVTHTSSKTEIKSNILATPTGLLKIQNTEEMSIRYVIIISK